MLVNRTTEFIFCAHIRSMAMALVILVLVSCDNEVEKPEDIAIKYVQAVYLGDLELFKHLTLPETYHEEISEDYYLFVSGKSTARMLTAIQRNGVKSITVESKRIHKDIGHVELTVRFNNNDIKRISIPMIRRKKSWYVEATHWHYW